MDYGLYMSAAGAEAQSQRMQVMTNNLANVDTVGFKRDFAISQARHAEEIERGQAVPGLGSGNDVGGGVFLRETITDFSHGVYQETGMPTDMAIEDRGENFFAIDKDGETYLTRAGNFQIDSTGTLRTQMGDPVLAEGDVPARIDPLGPPPTVSTKGELVQGSNRVRLAIKTPKSRGDLVKAGENLFRPLAKVADADDASRRVRGGYLEGSSVKPIEETVGMIEAGRAYEANVRMIQHHDSTIGALVNRVLKQS